MTNPYKSVACLLMAVTGLFASWFTYASNRVAQDAEVTILSSNLANGGTVGEWGLSALAEADGHCVLFDAGPLPRHRAEKYCSAEA